MGETGLSVIRLGAAPVPPVASQSPVGIELPEALIADLLRATGPDDLRRAVEGELCRWFGARTCRLHLAGDPASDRDALPAYARAVLPGAAPATKPDEHRFRVALHRGTDRSVTGVLYGEFDPADGRAAPSGERLAIAGRLLELAIETVHDFDSLRESMTQLRQAERLQRALYAITELASADRDMTGMLAELHAIVASLMYAENLFIVLYDRSAGTIRFPYYVDIADLDIPDPAADFPLDEWQGSLTWHLLVRGQALMGTIAELQAQIGEQLPQFGPDCVDWLGVPLIRSEEVVGGIVVQSYTESARFSDQDRILLTYVAQHILTALERKQAHAELERRVAERTDALRDANRVLRQQVEERKRGERLQAALFRIAELTNAPGVEGFYAAMHRVIGSLLYARNFYIALLSEDQSQLTFAYSVDEFDRFRAPRRLGRGLTEYVLRTGRPLLADRAEIERLNACGEVLSSGARALCWLGVPLNCDDQPVGVLALQSYSEEQRYTLRDQALLTFVSYHVANALQRKRNAESLEAAYAELERRVEARTAELAAANTELHAEIGRRERIERQLKHEALHDALTGLPNRTLFLQRLGQALAAYRQDERKLFAVLFLDLDRFKVINDSVGHLVGDELLVEVGRRLGNSSSAQDTVARLGGDEFAVLLSGIGHVDEAIAHAQRLIDVLDAPISLGEKALFTSTSIGIALAAPQYRSPEELLRDADAAMYRAKAEGRRRHTLFDQRLHRDALDLLELESDLRQALVQHEFEPWFQPVIDLTSGRTAGYEALVRWRHPQRGLLKPADFLAVAEGAGLNEAIDWQVFEQACQAVPKVAGERGFVAINISGHHFNDADLAERLLGLFAKHAVDPSMMRIEVTEHVLLENSAQAQATIGRLRAAGVGIALDDFGTGYSSLSYLRHFPLQALKIDRSFVAELGDAGHSSHAVVRAILALAGSLDLQAIAEGIETRIQRERLVALGCRFGQGYLLGRPQPVDAWRASAADA